MMGDVVRSKPWLGFLGNFSAIMATLAAFGFAMYCGIDFIGLNLAAPFLMIGKFSLFQSFVQCFSIFDISIFNFILCKNRYWY